MSEPLGISKLVAMIGDENIQVQNILANATDFKDGKKAATITFTTAPATVQELMQASVAGRKSKIVGLVLWFPADRLIQENGEWRENI